MDGQERDDSEDDDVPLPSVLLLGTVTLIHSSPLNIIKLTGEIITEFKLGIVSRVNDMLMGLFLCPRDRRSGTYCFCPVCHSFIRCGSGAVG